MKKAGCGMQAYEGQVFVFGGLGSVNGSVQPGSEWLKMNDQDNENDPKTKGYTNEMHKYDFNEKSWVSVAWTGSRPPPIAMFSFTMIGRHQAVVFGGKLARGINLDCYIFNLATVDWLRIPPWSGEDGFVGRYSHAAVCLDYGGEKPLLLVTGGLDETGTVLSDMWLIEVFSGRRKKIRVPSPQPRHCHCAATFHLSPGIMELIIFGGATRFPTKHYVADTTLLRLQKDTTVPNSEWYLTDEAYNSERGTTKRLQEKMTKLGQISHELWRREQEAIRLKEEAIRRLEEATKGNGQETGVEKNAPREQWVVMREEIEITDERIGGGGWGEVKVAIYRSQRVAAKVLYPELHYFHSIFVREMNMASRIHFPNLVQFLGACMDRDMVILMELIPLSLRTHLSRVVPLVVFRLSVSLDVAKALNYLHLMKPNPILHRDISSSNVLVEPLADDKWRAKVADYGTVNFQDEVDTIGPGNIAYAAPEAKEPSFQSPKMDIFSYGVLLLEMCTCHFPYLDKRQEMIASLQAGQWLDLILHCLQRDLEERPKASEIITLLDSWSS